MVGHLLSWIWTIPRVPYLFHFVYLLHTQTNVRHPEIGIFVKLSEAASAISASPPFFDKIAEVSSLNAHGWCCAWLVLRMAGAAHGWCCAWPKLPYGASARNAS